jgi:predicted aspartyl protease
MVNRAFTKRLLKKKYGIGIIVFLFILFDPAKICLVYGTRPGQIAEDIYSAKVTPLVNFETETYQLNIQDELDSLVIPIKRAGNLILMEVAIDSLSGNMILDTGSSSLVLNSIYFRNGNRRSNYSAGGVTGSVGTVSRIQIDHLNISELYFNNLTANVSDLSHIEKARNVRILGFCGLSIFKDFEVVVDLKNAVVELHRTNYSGKRIHGDADKPKTNIEIQVEVISNVVFIDGIVNRRKLRFCLDTGAESNVVNSGLSGRILDNVEITGRSNLRGAGNQKIEVLYGVLNELKIGNRNILPMPVVLTNLSAMSNYYGIPVDGMLGCDFLEKGVFYFNVKRQTLGINFYNSDDEHE